MFLTKLLFVDSEASLPDEVEDDGTDGGAGDGVGGADGDLPLVPGKAPPKQEVVPQQHRLARHPGQENQRRLKHRLSRLTRQAHVAASDAPDADLRVVKLRRKPLPSSQEEMDVVGYPTNILNFVSSRDIWRRRSSSHPAPVLLHVGPRP